LINHCDNLDAYLAEDLPPDAATQFSLHLTQCEVCQEAVEEQQWIDGLLRSKLGTDLEIAPAKLLYPLRTAISRRRVRLKVAACGLAAATLCIVAIGWTTLLNRQPNDSVIEMANPIASQNKKPHSEFVDATPEVTPTPRATFVGGPDMIVIPVDSPHPDVTIVRVYTTYQSTYAAQANVERPRAQDKFAWPDGSNGG
jgi:hypothetical protein